MSLCFVDSVVDILALASGVLNTLQLQPALECPASQYKTYQDIGDCVRQLKMLAPEAPMRGHEGRGDQKENVTLSVVLL